MDDRNPYKVEHADSIGELTRVSLITLCAAGTLGGWLWLFIAWSLAASPERQLPLTATFTPPAMLAGVCLACLILHPLPLRGRCALFLLGIAAALLFGCVWQPAIAWLYYLALVVVASGLLVGSATSFVTALILTAASLSLTWVGAIPLPILSLLPALGLLWGAALVAWLSSRSLITALEWALHSQQRARHLLEELRTHQGELNRTLAALTEASRRLERTNRELAVARQRAEEARVLKEQFVANVSHELRTPLNLIVGFAEMMYLSPESYNGVVWTPTLEGDIHEIYRASRHLQSLVDDILDLSRIDALRLPMFRELQDIRAIIADAAETIRPLLRQHGLSYHAEWPDELPQLFVDRTRIRQVLLNLLNNAIRHTEKGGITVTVELTEEAVVVAVRDSGVGIPPDQLERVFEKFHQVNAGLRRPGGVGLGLTLCRQFIELHGGRIWAESQVGQGSTFYFSLPLPGALPQSTRLQGIAHRPHPDIDPGAVVVVDSDPTIAEMLSRYLGDRRALPAADAQEAEMLVESEHPQAVIVNQPPEVPAESWIGPLGPHSLRYGVPILRCSLPSSSWLRQVGGFDDLLSKPVSRAALGALLARRCPHTGTILVVDDDPGFVQLMARVLGTFEQVQQVLVACSGAQALRLAGEKHPDLILLDLLMPEMDGFEALHALRSDPTLSHTAIVAVSATSYAEEALQRQGTLLTLSQSSGMSPGTLLEAMNAVLQIVHPSYAVDEAVK